MKLQWLLLWAGAQGLDLSALPEAPDRGLSPRAEDWLVTPVDSLATVYRDGSSIVLDNELCRRTIQLAPNAATIGLDELTTGRSWLRAVEPEARIVVEGHAVDIGGLAHQPNRAYLDPRWLDELETDPAAFVCTGFEIVPTSPRLDWRAMDRVYRSRSITRPVQWPPGGFGLRLDFAPPADAPAELRDVRVSVHHELYDGVPVLAKWINVTNVGKQPFVLDDFTIERLAIVERDSIVEGCGPALAPPALHVESEYSMGGMTPFNAGRHGVRWVEDPAYLTQVNYRRKTPCLLEVGPERLVSRTLQPGETFTSYRSFILVDGSEDRTRRALSLCRMYETIAPWTIENPLMMHVRSSDEESVKSAILQASQVGFEMVILTFGSGFDMEDDSAENLEKWRRLATFAHDHWIEIGGYSLFSSRRVQPDGDNCKHPETGKPGGQIHGFCPAATSAWGQAYFSKLRRFFEFTGFDLLEHDGPYPGDLDATARPPLQVGLEDSRFAQWNVSADFYRWLRARGVYVNAPDWYYLVGTNKCAMGYRESNWSLPRAQQVIHTRQNIFDGTRTKLPTMGWTFVPLTEYHGGGAAATVEPLADHLEHYELLLASNLGAGVQACYRGPRLFDSELTKDMVMRRVNWFKEHRAILESPIVHSASRRADGRDLDWILHANPRLLEQGFLMVFNPLDVPLKRSLLIPLYYTGLRERVSCVRQAAAGLGTVEELHELDERGRLRLQVEVPAGETRWVSLRRAE